MARYCRRHHHLHYIICLFIVILEVVTGMTKPLKTFLQGLSKFKRSNGEAHTLVIGNEAADADSIISAVTYAFLRQWQASTTKQPAVASLCLPIVPVVSIDRKQMYLRRDVELLLKEVEIELCDLITMDEYCDTAAAGVHLPSDLVLVDHNVASKSLSSILGLSIEQQEENRLVKEILDHHKDEQRYLGSTGGIGHREIAFDVDTGKATVASACTLVAERYLDAANIDALTEEIAILLVAVIAVDSINMDPRAGRGTQRDLDAMNALTSRYPSINRDRLFSLMSNAKLDPLFWDSLTAKDAIYLDFKEFQGQPTTSSVSTTMGVAAVLQPVTRFLTKPDLVEQLEDFFRNSNNDVLVVMTFLLQPVSRRELLFVTRTSERLQSMTDFFTSNAALSLSSIGLTPTQANLGGFKLAAYHQQNLSMSRKQVAPLLVEYYSTL